MLDLQEPINVWVYFRSSTSVEVRKEADKLHFKGNLVQPFVFFWKGRRIKIEKVNLVHTTKEGDKLFYHFSISSGGNFYQLKFDLEKLKWFIEAVEEEDL